MRSRFAPLLVALAFFGCSGSHPRLHAQGALTRADAERVALARVPHGSIKTSEFEEEDGNLYWSFVLVSPGKSEATEVEVDALSGAVLSIRDVD